MKISLILEAVNRASAPIRAVMQSVESLNRVTQAASRAMGTATSSMAMGFGKVAIAARGLGGRVMAMNDTIVDAHHHFRKLVGEEGLASASRSMGYFKNQVSGLTGGLSILKYAAAGAVIGLGEEFVRGVYKAGGETQRMLVTLTRLEGSATRARAAMSWMQDFAMGAGAGFSMPDIMRSYQMAKNFGMNPQGGSLSAFADLAAGERVPLKQVLYAIKDAMEGTSTRPLANLGIKMRQGKNGEPNSYLYSNIAGQFVTAQSAKTPEATLATLVRIINSKYIGLATQQAKTVPGGIEQLKKLLYLFEGKVASSGVLDWTLKQMNALFAYIRKASADGSLDRLAKQISNFITGTGDKLIKFLRDTDWKAVGRDLAVVAGSIVLLAKAIMVIAKLGGGGLSGLFNLWLIAKVIGFGRALFGLIPIVTTIVEVIAGFGATVFFWVAAAVVAGVLLYKNWGRISAWFSALPGKIKSAWGSLKGFFANLWASISNWQPPAWMRWLAGMGMIGSGNFGAGASLIAGAGAARPGPARPTQGQQHHRIGGKLTVEFQNAPAMRVKNFATEHPGFEIALKRGPVLAGQ